MKEKEIFEVFEVYVTKYALTKGIQKCTVKTTSIDGMLEDVKNPYRYYSGGEGKDWHMTLDKAIAKAIKMKNKKVKTLEKQIEKLKEMHNQWLLNHTT